MKTVSKLLLILSALMQMSGVANAAEVVFGFSNNYVTLVDKDQVFRFPTKVFASQFGHKQPGDIVDIPEQYKGFLVKGQNFSEAAIDAPINVEDIQYGGIVYHDYYGRVFSTELNGRIYSWNTVTLDTGYKIRSPASVKETTFLKGVTEEIKAQKVGSEIRYFDKTKKLLWVSNLR